MTAPGQALIATSVLACGIIYGTHALPAIVLRPALALAGDRTVVSTTGRVHHYRHPRLRVPAAAGFAAAIPGTATLAWAGHLGATVAGRHRGGRIGVLAHHLRPYQHAGQLPPHGRISTRGTLPRNGPAAHRQQTQLTRPGPHTRQVWFVHMRKSTPCGKPVNPVGSQPDYEWPCRAVYKHPA